MTRLRLITNRLQPITSRLRSITTRLELINDFLETPYNSKISTANLLAGHSSGVDWVVTFWGGAERVTLSFHAHQKLFKIILGNSLYRLVPVKINPKSVRRKFHLKSLKIDFGQKSNQTNFSSKLIALIPV